MASGTFNKKSNIGFHFNAILVQSIPNNIGASYFVREEKQKTGGFFNADVRLRRKVLIAVVLSGGRPGDGLGPTTPSSHPPHTLIKVATAVYCFLGLTLEIA